MKKAVTFFLLFLVFGFDAFAQLGINSDNSQPDPSAGLDVKFVNKGLLPPRMTTAQMNSVPSPAAGLVVYNTDMQCLCVFNGTAWTALVAANQSWNCGGFFTDTRDGRSYPTVQIGTQCWMRQNLNFGKRINGNLHQANNGIFEKYCYNDEESNCDTYGGFYEWGEMMNYTDSSSAVPSGKQGLCPPGWHIPSDPEWTVMVSYLGGSSVAGGMLKESGTSHWLSPNTGGSDQTGFVALGTGRRGLPMGAGFDNLYYLTLMWSSTYDAPGDGYFHHWLAYNSHQLLRSTYWPDEAISVRCIKD